MNLRSTSLALMLVTGLAAMSSCSEGGVDGRVVELFGGKKSVEAISASTRVEAFRVEDLTTKDADAKTIGGYRITAGPLKVDKAQAGALRSMLLSADSYQFDVAKACEFQPGAAVRFVGAEKTIDVLFCFGCDELGVYIDGKRIGGEDTDDIRAELVGVMRKVFPDDEVIQGIKATRN
jgi:hypothetical protein